MKNVIFSLIVLGSIAANAGTLENRRTGGTIDITVNHTQNTISIYSNTVLVDSKEVSFDSIASEQKEYKGDYYRQREPLFFVSEMWRDSLDEPSYIVGFTPFGLMANYIIGAADILTWPIRLPARILKSSKVKKDIRMLNKAISSDESVRVSNQRFERIAGILNAI